MYLDSETMKTVRGELDQLRRPGAYRPGKWSIGYLNREPVALGTTPPAKVYVRDITLRSVERPRGVGVTDEERILIGEALAKADIPSLQIAYFEKGFALDAGLLEDSIKRIKGVRPDVELCCIVHHRDEMELAATLGIDKVKFVQSCLMGKLSRVRASCYDAVWEGKDWRDIRVPENVDQQIEKWLGLIQAAKRIPVKIAIGQNHASYAGEEYLRELVPALVEAGADELTLSDSYHGLGPEAWRYLCQLVKGMAPKMDLAVHIHNDWGMATASAISCAIGGADYIEVAVNGMGGPGVGQADLAEVVAALEVLYGIGTGVDMKQLTSLSRLVADITRREMPSWKPITGDEAWVYDDLDSMIHAYEVDPLLPVPANPDIFGNKLIHGVVGCDSGNWVMYHKLRGMGLEVDKSVVPKILKAVKQQIRLRKRALSDEEIRALVGR